MRRSTHSFIHQPSTNLCSTGITSHRFILSRDPQCSAESKLAQRFYGHVPFSFHSTAKLNQQSCYGTFAWAFLPSRRHTADLVYSAGLAVIVSKWWLLVDCRCAVGEKLSLTRQPNNQLSERIESFESSWADLDSTHKWQTMRCTTSWLSGTYTCDSGCVGRRICTIISKGTEYGALVS